MLLSTCTLSNVKRKNKWFSRLNNGTEFKKESGPTVQVDIYNFPNDYPKEKVIALFNPLQQLVPLQVVFSAFSMASIKKT